MGQHTLKSVSRRGAAFGALALLGCTQLGQRAISTSRPTAAPARNFSTMLASTTSGASAISSSTVSFALDRIDQRGLPLDRTYRRSGTGRGVTVYVFDGGISAEHPELAGRVRAGYSAFPSDPKICNAHGTAVAGAVAGRTLGVAPEASIVDVKMVECGTLRGTIKGIVDGAKWVIEDHKKRGGPAIANWSFIADTAAVIPALDSAVTALRAAGIAVIVSAGNLDINACQVSPANAHGTIVAGATQLARESAQGATNMKDRRAEGTAYGACIDFYAPGDSVLLPSLDADLRPIAQVWNGTSMSAGYVSGAAALFLEAQPNATPDQVRAHLQRSATPNVVEDSRAPVTWLLYVGVENDPQRRVASRR